MTFTIISYLTRNPAITLEQFKDYYENTHLPSIKSTFGDAAPLYCRRYYLARTANETSEGQASPIYISMALRGTPEEFDYDCIAELTWEDRERFRAFNKMHTDPENAKVLADEGSFLVREKTKVVVIGSVCESSPRNGY